MSSHNTTKINVFMQYKLKYLWERGPKFMVVKIQIKSALNYIFLHASERQHESIRKLRRKFVSFNFHSQYCFCGWWRRKNVLLIKRVCVIVNPHQSVFVFTTEFSWFSSHFSEREKHIFSLGSCKREREGEKIFRESFSVAHFVLSHLPSIRKHNFVFI